MISQIMRDYTPDEIRDKLSWRENVGTEELTQAVMCLCTIVGDQEQQIKKLKELRAKGLVDVDGRNMTRKQAEQRLTQLNKDMDRLAERGAFGSDGQVTPEKLRLQEEHNRLLDQAGKIEVALGR